MTATQADDVVGHEGVVIGIVDDIAGVVLNRPDKLDAIDPVFVHEIVAAPAGQRCGLQMANVAQSEMMGAEFERSIVTFQPGTDSARHEAVGFRKLVL